MSSTFTDEELFSFAKKKDEDAFRKIFDRYYVPLCRYALLFTGNSHDAEEAVLDVFAVLWERGRSIELKSSLRQYIFRSVRNRSLNYLRKNKKEEKISDQGHEILMLAETDTTAFGELMEVFEKAVLSLPDKCAEVFRLSRIEGLTHREIAGRLRISEKTVEAHIAKALERIRRQLKNPALYSFFL